MLPSGRKQCIVGDWYGVCVRACMCVCVHACVRVCVRERE